jgi:RNA polymerase sigma-70 factor (ECF subfamily)
VSILPDGKLSFGKTRLFALGPPNEVTVSNGASHFAADQLLAAAVAGGDASARHRLVLRVMPRVRTVARRILPSASDVDDAVQNAVLEVLRSLHTYQGQTNLERWVDRITARVSLRQAMDMRKRLKVVEPVEELPPVAAVVPSVSTSLDVARQLKALPDGPREAVQLRYILGFSVEEIAECTHAPLNTVKTRLKTGLRLLRASMGLAVEPEELPV